LFKSIKGFFTFFALQTVAFTILVTNLRAISTLHYAEAAATEVAYLYIQWTLLKKIAGTTNAWEKAGYMLGGAAGTLISMWATRMWGS
jgi:hypothetical protein